MTSLSSKVEFAHPAEQQFAQLLDFYGIVWQYEPHRFDLAFHPDGALKQAFVPDFYLPQADLYVELTTMGQRQLTRKHRKIRTLRERYPHVRVRLLGRKHLEALWGRFGLATGTDGCPLWKTLPPLERHVHDDAADLSSSA
ncbi:MAG: hypothetical protein KGR26_10595 [Cyanobacteria bacterium REEB65]|nr:hypothetical protein [Cyanobacteria bacterium REEB65]